MINKKMEQAINSQINAEFYSAYLYLAMAADFESINLKGFASWMRNQAMEELSHGKKLYDYLISRGGKVILVDIKAPPKSWKTPIIAFQDAYKHEQKVTELINNLVDLSIELKDYATNAFLQWFVNEQVEEEGNVNDIIHSMKLIDKNTAGLYTLDKELGQRIFTTPTGVTI